MAQDDADIAEIMRLRQEDADITETVMDERTGHMHIRRWLRAHCVEVRVTVSPEAGVHVTMTPTT